MIRRDKNVRKACDEINETIYWIFKNVDCKGQGTQYYFTEKIKKLVHKIKRTTWRGKEKQNKDDLIHTSLGWVSVDSYNKHVKTFLEKQLKVSSTNDGTHY